MQPDSRSSSSRNVIVLLTSIAVFAVGVGQGHGASVIAVRSHASQSKQSSTTATSDSTPPRTIPTAVPAPQFRCMARGSLLSCAGGARGRACEGIVVEEGADAGSVAAARTGSIAACRAAMQRRQRRDARERWTARVDEACRVRSCDAVIDGQIASRWRPTVTLVSTSDDATLRPRVLSRLSQMRAAMQACLDARDPLIPVHQRALILQANAHASGRWSSTAPAAVNDRRMGVCLREAVRSALPVDPTLQAARVELRVEFSRVRDGQGSQRAP